MAPNLPKTYKVALFKKANEKLSIEDYELKLPEHGEILIKVHATGVCHSDSMSQAGLMGSPFPLIPGHESIGTVAAVGPGEKKWKVGDRVGAAWHGGHDDGEYAIIRTEAAVAIPGDVDPAAFAPLMCAGVTVFNSIRQLKVTPGATVAIQGLGGLGHLGLQYANKMGYRTVALSSSASKEKFAKDLGAHEYIDGSKQDHAEALQKLGGADLIVATAPNPDIIGKLIYGLAPLGKLLILARKLMRIFVRRQIVADCLQAVGDVPVNTFPMVQKGLSVVSWPSGHALDSQDAVEFARLQGVNCMIEKFPLSQANEAFEHMMSGKARFRAVITME